MLAVPVEEDQEDTGKVLEKANAAGPVRNAMERISR
jgi:hypothetical protein